MALAAGARKAAAAQGRVARTAQGHFIPAPIGGLNAKDSYALMPETDAIIFDNFFPQPSWVELRQGKTTLGTFSGNCETLMGYNALAASTSELFAAVNTGTVKSIYRVDNLGGGAAGSPVVGGAGGTVQAITSTQYDYLQFGNSSVSVLYALNGQDDPLLYDGTTWHQITTTSTPYALTGGPTLSSLQFGVVYKQRIWFVQAGTFNVYYTQQTDFAGSLTLLNLGANFVQGGYLQTIVTVSVDNSAGTQDYIAFISNKGEIVIFQGYDPSQASTWYEAAHGMTGVPVGIGRRAWQQLGMDAILMTTDGFLLMSQIMLTDRAQTQQAVSDKIRAAVSAAVLNGRTYEGWQVKLFPAGNKLLIVVPTTASPGSSYLFVQNTLSSAWATWGNVNGELNPYCLEVFNNLLYMGSAGAVYQLDNATTEDNGAAITATVKTAYSYMGDEESLKTWQMCQPVFNASGNLSLSLTLSVDFDSSVPTGTIPVSVQSQAPWNTSYWNTPTYWGQATRVIKNWLGLNGEGYCGSLYMSIASQGLSAKWFSTNFMFNKGGLFNGP